ncbi:thiamine phosphate synthase [Clostridium tetanomorphum]|uniref:thiamine phosphate synthase n=1 Tax=Clostridium tetanomorphum TaxID=1553 RepID=UPI0028BE57F7|nr:thiamine phosphate synthase [Clostridium tetanomorphum]
MISIIYVVTNRKLCKEDNFLYTIEKCLYYGADALSLREKDLNYEELYSLGEKIKIITDKYKVPLIINGNQQVSQDLQCWGYHCGIPAIKENKYKDKNIKLGVSIHSTYEALEAENYGADYIIAGHIYETKCKEGLKGRGIEFLKEIVAKVSIPTIAIGGIKESNIQEVMKAGVKGIAIMSSAMEDPHVIKKLKKLL